MAIHVQRIKPQLRICHATQAGAKEKNRSGKIKEASEHWNLGALEPFQK